MFGVEGDKLLDARILEKFARMVSEASDERRALLATFERAIVETVVRYKKFDQAVVETVRRYKQQYPPDTTLGEIAALEGEE